MKFPGFDVWRQKKDKEKGLIKKYRGEDKPPAERDEGMFERATDRASSQAYMQERRSQLLRELKAKYGVEEMEMFTVGELLDGLTARTKEVNEKLTAEESTAREIQKMGGVVSAETREKINALDEKLKALIKLHGEVVTPNLMEAFRAKSKGEELLVPKPAEWDALMQDRIEPAPQSEPRPSSMELQKYERMLQEDSEEIEREIGDMIDDVNAYASLEERSDKTANILEAMNVSENERPHVEARLTEMYDELRKARDQVQSIELNAGMAQRLEGAEMRRAA